MCTIKNVQCSTVRNIEKFSRIIPASKFIVADNTDCCSYIARMV